MYVHCPVCTIGTLNCIGRLVEGSSICSLLIQKYRYYGYTHLNLSGWLSPAGIHRYAAEGEKPFSALRTNGLIRSERRVPKAPAAKLAD